MTNVVVHSAAVTRIVLNDAEGYFITGSQDGEIKVIIKYIVFIIFTYVKVGVVFIMYSSI